MKTENIHRRADLLLLRGMTNDLGENRAPGGLARDGAVPSRPLISAWSVVPALLVDGLCPFLTYMLLRRYVHGVSELMALGLGALFPAARGFVELSRRGRIDIIGAIVLVGIGVSVVALLVGGTPRLLLIRESFVTGALGLIALSSFAWPRPLLFYIGRQLSGSEDGLARERFDALWERQKARRTFRLITLVWAVGWLGEFGLRIAMVLTLSVSQVLAISPIVFNGITGGLIAWTLAYTERKRRGAEATGLPTQSSDGQRN
jgi:hypothetical protein